MIVQNLALQRGQWLSFLWCYVILPDGENNLPSTPFRIYTQFNKKCACTNEAAARNLCKERLGVLGKWLSLNCFSRSLVMKPIGLFKRGGRVPKSFFFEKPNKTMYFFRSAFQSTLLEHAGEVFVVFFVLRNADFFNLKNASELSWGKVLLIRVLYREKIIRHGWSVTLTYCYRLCGLSASSNRHAVLRKLLVWQQKREFGTVVNISLTQKYENYEKLENIKTWQ